MSNLEKAKLFIVSGPLDKPLDADKVKSITQGTPEVEVQFNPTTLKVSLANSLKENEKDSQSKASQFIGKSSSSLSVELVFDTSDSYHLVQAGDDSGETKPKIDDVRDHVKKIAINFMTPSKIENKKAVPERCLFAWGSFVFVGIMESLEETLDFFAPEGIPLRASVALKMSESRFQFLNKEAETAKRESPEFSSAPESTPQANEESGRDESDWRDTAMYNGVESPRAPTEEGLSVPSASASASLKAQASGSIGGGIAGGFSAGLGAGFSAGAGGSLGLSAGLSGGLSGGLSAGAGIGGGLNAGISGGLSGGLETGLSGGISGSVSGLGVDASMSGSLGGGLSSSVNVTPPAFSFGSSASVGTNIPGAFSTDFKKGGGLSAGSILSGGVNLNGNNLNSTSSTSSTVSNSSGSATASASASASSGGLFGDANASASASVGFD